MYINKQKKNDIILITALLLLAAVLCVFIFLRMSTYHEGESYSLRISIDGEIVFEDDVKDLTLPFYYKVETEDGGENIFRLSYVSLDNVESKTGDLDETLLYTEDNIGLSCVYANCPEQICVNTGIVSLPDTPIVCLPHKVIALLSLNQE